MSTLKLSYPVTPAIITQHFGGNAEYYQANGVDIIGHNGTDLLAYHGQPVYAPMDGRCFYEIDTGGGHGVVIVANDKMDYKAGSAIFKVILWHFCDPKKETKYASPIYVALGKKANTGQSVPVKKGDLVGFADSTGLSTGDHVHFGLKPMKVGSTGAGHVVDITDTSLSDFVNIEQDNGYVGAINPEPYFDNTFVSTTGTATVATPSPFKRDLEAGMSGSDVLALQQYLNRKGYTLALTGAGSAGKETSFFGPATKAAVMKLQASNAITPVAGYFGAKTRAWVDSHP